MAAKKFEKGKSGNPGGRPKRDINLVRACKDFNAEGLRILKNIARKKSHRQNDRIRAVELILAYGNGKPKQGVEISGPDGGPVTIASADLLAQLERLERALTPQDSKT